MLILSPGCQGAQFRLSSIVVRLHIQGSVHVFVTHKSCPSALDLLQCVDVIFGMCVPGSRSIVKCWMDHGILGCRSNLFCAIPKVVGLRTLAFMMLWQQCCPLASFMSDFHFNILTPGYLLQSTVSRTCHVNSKRCSSLGACWCRN